MIYYRFGWLPEMVLQSCGLAVISERSGDPDRQVGTVMLSCRNAAEIPTGRSGQSCGLVVRRQHHISSSTRVIPAPPRSTCSSVARFTAPVDSRYCLII